MPPLLCKDNDYRWLAYELIRNHKAAFESIGEAELSWALRERAVHDGKAVKMFLDEHAGVQAARVKREVRNKLRTGLKNPKRKNR